MNVLVSIIVANFNCDKYIDEFIQSIIAQTYNNWELIMVDDGSNDASLPIIERYASIDFRIKLIRRTNTPRGANHCRNIGLASAIGKYVCFFDSDDLVPDYTIEVRVLEMENNPSMDFIIFPAITFNNKPYDRKELVIGIDSGYDNIDMFLRRYRLPFAVWTNIYRRDFLINQSIEWDNKLMSMQDSDFNLTILNKPVNYKFSTDTRPNYYWRQTNNVCSITNTIKTVKNIESQLYFFNKLRTIYENTKYAKSLSCFKLTLMHRTIYLNYLPSPLPLLYETIDNIKYKFLKRFILFLNVKNEKISYSLFMIFFPIRFLQEIVYRYKNHKHVQQYFKMHVK